MRRPRLVLTLALTLALAAAPALVAAGLPPTASAASVAAQPVAVGAWTTSWTTSAAGATPGPHVQSSDPTISADGTLVTFLSSLRLEGDATAWPNGYGRAYVLGAGATVPSRLALSGAGLPGNANDPSRSGVSLSDDGRWAVFTSTSDNLTAGDTNDQDDVFLRDLRTGKVQLVSRDAAGGPSDGASNFAELSGDGRTVLFASLATDLTPDPHVNQGIYDWFLHDTVTRTTTHLPFYASEPRLSSDGRSIVGVTPPASSGLDRQVGPYLYDVTTGTYSLVGVLNTGKALGGYSASISDDGTLVSFIARNNHSKLYVRNLTTGRTVTVPLPADTYVASAELSGDGSRLAMITGTQGNRIDFVVRVTDLRGRVLFQSRKNVYSFNTVSIDRSGRCISFDSFQAELATDRNGGGDVYTACQS